MDPLVRGIGNVQEIQKITGRDMQIYLADPQALNAYSYTRNNPVIFTDKSGKAFGIDDGVAFLGGGLVGLGVQFTQSIIFDDRPTLGDLTRSFITGGIAGVVASNTTEAAGITIAGVASAVVMNGAIGLIGNASKQIIDVSTGAQTNFSGKELAISGLFSAATGPITEFGVPKTKIPGITIGQGNMNAVGKQLQTKVANGTINDIIAKSSVKSTIGTQTTNFFKTIAEAGIDKLKNLFVSDKSKEK